MKKIIPTLLFIATFIACNAQTNIDLFEVHTKLAHPQANSGGAFNRDSIIARINSIPDTATTIATFVLATSDPSKIDSLFFTLTNSQGTVVYNGAIKVSAMTGNPAFRQGGKTMYYTIAPYAYLKRFSATVKVRSVNGTYSSVKAFAKTH